METLELISYGSVRHAMLSLFYRFLVLSRDCIKGLSESVSIFSGKMFLNHKYTKKILKQLPFPVTGGRIKSAFLSALYDCQDG